VTTLTYGFAFNKEDRHRVTDCPEWLSRSQREKWGKRGLILWDRDQCQVTRLSAGQALYLLTYLRGSEEWEEGGLSIGEPATWMSLDDPESGPEVVFVDQIEASPERIHELLSLLQDKEIILQQMKEEDAQEELRILTRAYRYILSANWGGKDTDDQVAGAVDS